MTEGDALLRAILEEPDDTGLRLIYADWLEDHGDEVRADFIRRYVEWDNLPECGHDWVNDPSPFTCPT